MSELRHANSGAVGLDALGLARADAHIASYIERGLLPCGLLLVARDGAIAHLSVQGLADRERARPVAEDTVFRIYSMTKPVTSVALLMLMEEGRVQLDEPVAKYIPDFAKTGVFKAGSLETGFLTAPPGRPMTVRDLLTHQSGLTYEFQNRTNIDAAYRALKLDQLFKGSLAEFTAHIAELPLEFSPGSAWNYSVSSDIAGRIVEIISGRSLEDFFRERIFEPLGMEETGFFVPPEAHERFAACYRRGPDGALTLADDPEKSVYRARPAFLSGGGGLVSTAADYFRFAEMLRGGGSFEGTRLLGHKTVALMTANHLPDGADMAARSVGLFSETGMKGFGFGLGVSVMLDPAQAQLPGSPGEFAWGGAASTYFWADPAEALTVIFMTQFVPSSALNIRRELRGIIYGALV
jgi:CubicO group peptidase (beta-lactamase class C family)